jgi:glycosyltransferase involved in cell wall biosynthesis
MLASRAIVNLGLVQMKATPCAISYGVLFYLSDKMRLFLNHTVSRLWIYIYKRRKCFLTSAGGDDIADVHCLLGGLLHCPGGQQLDQVQDQRTPSVVRLAVIATLNRWKNVDSALAAVERAYAEGVKCSVVVVGDGRLLPQLTRRYRLLVEQGVVQFHKTLDRDRVFDLLSTSDALIHPSLRETYGFVVLEAMTCGCSVVAMDIFSNRKLLGPSLGHLVMLGPKRDVVEHIKDAICTLARNRVAYGKAVEYRSRSKLFTSLPAIATTVDHLLSCVSGAGKA